MKLYPMPEKYEKISSEYTVTCRGENVGVYSCDVSAHPFNQVWPGYQRPKSQTEKSAFLMLSSDDAVTLDISPKKSFEKVTVRPLSRKITPKAENGTVKITFPSAGQYIVEFDNPHNVLAVFINPEKSFEKEGDVLYFGPGVHYADKRIELSDNRTVFIDEGAVLYGAFEAFDKKNIKIVGYGIIDNSLMKREHEINGCSILKKDRGEDSGNPIFLERCENVLIEGVTIVDSSGWNVYLDGCHDITVDNIKIIGQWRYNADGVDFCNCQRGVIRKSFLRNFDDCITVKGFKRNNHLPCEDILAEGCVLWCDWGRALEVGAETSAPYMKNITFRDCDIVFGTHIMMDVQHGDRATVENVRFENIRAEYRAFSEAPLLQESDDAVYSNLDDKYMASLFEVIAIKTMWAIDKDSGVMHDIYFKDIAVTTEDDHLPKNPRILSTDGEDRIRDIYFENITVNASPCDMETLSVKVGDGAKNIFWK